MEDENKPISVASMVRQTGENTYKFLEQVALHIESLEDQIVRLREHINKLEKSDEA